MAKDVNPRSDYPDQSRRGIDATQASTPAEPGQGRLDEKGMWDKNAHPWPDVKDAQGLDRPVLNTTPGLAPGSETHAALKEQLTPDVERVTVEPNLMGGPEPMDGYVIPPDGQAKYMPPSWHGPWSRNETEGGGQ